MAKRVRRARQAPSIAEPVRPVQPVRINRSMRPPVEHAVKAVDFGKEYHYVIKDLKLTFIIAAALLVSMIVLALFIA